MMAWNIPVSAGLAGGSTDAAAVLKGINEYFGLGLSLEELIERGVKLGADVPFCIMGGTAYAGGIGEEIYPLETPEEYIVLVAVPDTRVSTKWAYNAYDEIAGGGNVRHPDIDQLRAAAGERKIVMLAEGKNVDNFTIGGFDMNYGWDYKDELVKVWKGAPASDLIKADKAEYDSLPAGKVKLRFTTNHDHSTEATPCVEFTNDRGAMAAYVASIFPHGGALIYGSQEVGYPKPINFFKYVPVDWSAKPEIYKEYQMLIGLYNEHPALRKGKMTAWPDNDVLVFEKADDAERYLILVNVRNEQKTVKIPEEWKKLGEALTLEPFEYCIEKY